MLPRNLFSSIFEWSSWSSFSITIDLTSSCIKIFENFFHVASTVSFKELKINNCWPGELHDVVLTKAHHARIDLSFITILVKLTLGWSGVTTDDYFDKKNLRCEIHVSVLTYSRITRNGGYHSLLAVSVLRLTYSMLQPNLDPENSSVSFKTKVLFTNRQVTKSNCINLTGFGLRQNVQVLRTTQSLLWYQRTAVLLTYYHVINVPYKLLTSRRLHCYSRRSQWNSIPRSSTTIIWSLESLLRRKEQSKWEETV